MEAFRWQILIISLFVSSYAEPNLVVREEIDGQWGDSGIIPCTYAPSPEYVEETVVWYFSGNAILRLVDSVPHTLVNKYRERISLSRSHPGDVSLRINDLQMMDKGQYTCEVVWRSKQSNDQIHEDAITKLNVIKAKISVTSTAKKPMIEVTSTQGPGLTEVALTTKKPMIEVTSTRRPGSTEDEPSLVIREEIDGQWRGSVIIPCTYAPSTEYVEENIIWSFGGRVILRQEESVEHVYLTKDRGRLRLSKSHPGDASLSINDLQMDDKGQYNCEVVWRLKSTDGLLQKDATTKLNIIRAVWATTTLGIPLYLLILICVLCIAVVGIVAAILITRRRKKLNQIYEAPNMSFLLAREDGTPSQANGCRSCQEPNPRKENDYEPLATKGVEKETTYEEMMALKEAEYELLIPEKEEKVETGDSTD